MCAFSLHNITRYVKIWSRSYFKQNYAHTNMISMIRYIFQGNSSVQANITGKIVAFLESTLIVQYKWWTGRNLW